MKALCLSFQAVKCLSISQINMIGVPNQRVAGAKSNALLSCGSKPHALTFVLHPYFLSFYHTIYMLSSKIEKNLMVYSFLLVFLFLRGLYIFVLISQRTPFISSPLPINFNHLSQLLHLNSIIYALTITIYLLRILYRDLKIVRPSKRTILPNKQQSAF